MRPATCVEGSIRAFEEPIFAMDRSIKRRVRSITTVVLSIKRRVRSITSPEARDQSLDRREPNGEALESQSRVGDCWPYAVLLDARGRRPLATVTAKRGSYVQALSYSDWRTSWNRFPRWSRVSGRPKDRAVLEVLRKTLDESQKKTPPP
jgi:hypothetical protein